MTNNPMSMIAHQMQRGVNPKLVLSQMARTDPQIAQIFKIIGNKNEAELRQFTQNLAKERGVDLNELAKSYGITIPSNR